MPGNTLLYSDIDPNVIELLYRRFATPLEELIDQKLQRRQLWGPTFKQEDMYKVDLPDSDYRIPEPENQKRTWVFSGTLTAGRTIRVPPIFSAWWFVFNRTAHPLHFLIDPAGTIGPIIAPNTIAAIITDGVEIFVVSGGVTSASPFVAEWRWDETTGTGDPGTGRIAVDTADPTAATILRISETSNDGVDMTSLFTALVAGSAVYIQDKNDSSQWFRYNITGPGTDQGTYWTFPVVLDAEGTTDIANNELCTVVFTVTGTVGDSMRLDQVLDPAAAKTFSMANYSLAYNYAGTAAGDCMTIQTLTGASVGGNVLLVKSPNLNSKDPFKVEVGPPPTPDTALMVTKDGHISMGYQGFIGGYRTGIFALPTGHPAGSTGALYVEGNFRYEPNGVTSQRGDMYFRDVNQNLGKLGIGTVGQVLTVKDVGAGVLEPRWDTPAGGGGSTRLDQILAPTANTNLAMAGFQAALNYAAAVPAGGALRIDSASSAAAGGTLLHLKNTYTDDNAARLLICQIGSSTTYPLIVTHTGQVGSGLLPDVFNFRMYLGPFDAGNKTLVVVGNMKYDPIGYGASAAGDLYFRGSDTFINPIHIGTLNQVLTVKDVGGGVLLPQWGPPPAAGSVGRLDQIDNPLALADFTMGNFGLDFMFTPTADKDCTVFETTPNIPWGGSVVWIRTTGTASQLSPLRVTADDKLELAVTQDGVGVGPVGVDPSARFHVVGSVRFDIGSDMSGDMFCRGTGVLERIQIDTVNKVLTVTDVGGGVLRPRWQSPAAAGATKLNQVLSPDANTAFTMPASTQVAFTWAGVVPGSGAPFGGVLLEATTASAGQGTLLWLKNSGVGTNAARLLACQVGTDYPFFVTHDGHASFGNNAFTGGYRVGIYNLPAGHASGSTGALFVSGNMKYDPAAGSWNATTSLPGSNAPGDVYFRDTAGNGEIVRGLSIGSNGQILTVVAGMPAWTTSSGTSTLTNLGNPTADSDFDMTPYRVKFEWSGFVPGNAGGGGGMLLQSTANATTSGTLLWLKNTFTDTNAARLLVCQVNSETSYSLLVTYNGQVGFGWLPDAPSAYRVSIGSFDGNNRALYINGNIKYDPVGYGANAAGDLYFRGTDNNINPLHTTGITDGWVLTKQASGLPAWAAPPTGTGTVSLDQVTNPGASKTFTMTNFTLGFTYTGTSAVDCFTIQAASGATANTTALLLLKSPNTTSKNLLRCEVGSGPDTVLHILNNGQVVFGLAAPLGGTGYRVEIHPRSGSTGCLYIKQDMRVDYMGVADGHAALNGDVLYRDSNGNIGGIDITGTSGRFFKSNGTTPSWQLIAASDISVGTFKTGKYFFSASTTSAGLNVGGAAPGTNPTGSNGDIYYHTIAGRFRFFQNGSWVELGGTGSTSPGGDSTAQIQYNNAGTFGGIPGTSISNIGASTCDINMNGALAIAHTLGTSNIGAASLWVGHTNNSTATFPAADYAMYVKYTHNHSGLAQDGRRGITFYWNMQQAGTQSAGKRDIVFELYADSVTGTYTSYRLTGLKINPDLTNAIADWIGIHLTSANATSSRIAIQVDAGGGSVVFGNGGTLSSGANNGFVYLPSTTVGVGTPTSMSGPVAVYIDTAANGGLGALKAFIGGTWRTAVFS